MSRLSDAAALQAWNKQARKTTSEHSGQSLSYQTLDGISIKARRLQELSATRLLN